MSTKEFFQGKQGIPTLQTAQELLRLKNLHEQGLSEDGHPLDEMSLARNRINYEKLKKALFG